MPKGSGSCLVISELVRLIRTYKVGYSLNFIPEVQTEREEAYQITCSQFADEGEYAVMSTHGSPTRLLKRMLSMMRSQSVTLKYDYDTAFRLLV